MAGRQRLIPPVVVVALVTIAVVASGDTDVEVSRGAVVAAAAGVGLAITVVATGIEHRDQHPFPYGVLLLRMTPIPAALLVLLVFWILPDADREETTTPPGAEDDPGQSQGEPEGDAEGVDASDIIDAVFTVLLVATLVVAVYLARAVLRRWHRRRSQPPRLGASGPVLESDDPERWRRQSQHRAVRTGLARGRDAMLDEADPRRAIVAAYLAFEAHVRREGLVRDPAETQREYAARVLTAGGVSEPRHVTELVELFNAARFSTDRIGPADANAARDHIDALVGS